MDYSQMPDAEVLKLRDKLQHFHTGISDAKIGLTRSQDGFREVAIKDKRLNDLIFTLFVETHNELCKRFTSIKVSE